MTDQKKLCTKCDKVKSLAGGFYKAGTSWQKYCIPCHNSQRYNYAPSNKPYIKVLKGFAKLDEDIRNKIIFDISVRINYKDISKKYNINYQTLLSWKRNKTIK
jgi:hypothetical protein